jgi:hypothetical protein
MCHAPLAPSPRAGYRRDKRIETAKNSFDE